MTVQKESTKRIRIWVFGYWRIFSRHSPYRLFKWYPSLEQIRLHWQKKSLYCRRIQHHMYHYLMADEKMRSLILSLKWFSFEQQRYRIHIKALQKGNTVFNLVLNEAASERYCPCTGRWLLSAGRQAYREPDKTHRKQGKLSTTTKKYILRLSDVLRHKSQIFDISPLSGAHFAVEINYICALHETTI